MIERCAVDLVATDTKERRMAHIIRFILTNLPSILFIAALVIPILRHHRSFMSYLSWLLLLSVGVDMLWAGVFHVFFPAIASAQIGWERSPFEYEVGVADLAIGATAFASFWRSWDFKAAVVFYIVLFYAGVAVGHIREAVLANDYSPDNFGMLLMLTVVKIPLLIGLVWNSRPEARHRAYQ
jgi:hypothetical protein